MFVLAILQQFEIYHKNPANPMLMINSYIEHCTRVWIEYCTLKQQSKLRVEDLLFFMRLLGAPLGIEPETSFFEAARKFYRMSTIAGFWGLSNKKGLVNFKEILHSILKARLDECRVFEGLSEKGFKELEKHEIEFHYKLALRTLMQKTVKQREEIKRRSTRNSRFVLKNRRQNRQKSTKVKDKLEFHSSNPLYLYLICLMCLRVWRRFSENGPKETDPAGLDMTMSKGAEPTEEVQQTLENGINSSTIPIIRPLFPEERIVMDKSSYIVVPNYIMENT